MRYGARRRRQAGSERCAQTPPQRLFHPCKAPRGRKNIGIGIDGINENQKRQDALDDDPFDEMARKEMDVRRRRQGLVQVIVRDIGSASRRPVDPLRPELCVNAMGKKFPVGRSTLIKGGVLGERGQTS